VPGVQADRDPRVRQEIEADLVEVLPEEGTRTEGDRYDVVLLTDKS
jgi:hypothetical protein